MIGMLIGTVESIDARSALIQVSGVGYETYMPSADLSAMKQGQDVRVYTSLQVSQDALTLYGFSSLAEKRMFLQVQKVSGIGPKVALSLLSTLSVDEFLQALADNNVTALTRTPGLGKKGAQKIILELQGSLDLNSLAEDNGLRNNSEQETDKGKQTVIEGLMSLGWKRDDAVNAVHLVCEREHIASPVPEAQIANVLRMALSALDRGR